MSKPIAFPSPLIRARRPAPTAPPAGPERTLQAPARAASAAGTTPPEDCMTTGAGSPAAARRLFKPSQIAAEQRREVGVDRRRRAALVLAEAGQDLVRGGDVDPGKLPPQVLGERSLVGWVTVGEEQADRDRLGAALAQRRRQARGLPGAEWLDHPVGPDPLRRLEAQLALDKRGGLGRAEPVEVGAVLAGDLEDVGEAAGRDQGRAGAAFLEQRVGPDGHPVGEVLDRRGVGACAGKHLIDRLDHAGGLVVGGGRPLRGVDPLAVDEDGVGEGPAHVDAQEHGVKLAELRPQAQVSSRVRPSGPSTMWMPSSSWSRLGKSERRWPPRDSSRCSAHVAIAAASG